VTVRKILLIRRKRDAQEFCPGYDEHSDVQIGCLVLDGLVLYGCDPPMDSYFLKGGWSTLEGHTETGNVKYSWLRAGEAFVLSSSSCYCEDIPRGDTVKACKPVIPVTTLKGRNCSLRIQFAVIICE